MKIDRLLTDEAILAELGGRLAQRRLELRLTQDMLAEQRDKIQAALGLYMNEE